MKKSIYLAVLILSLLPVSSCRKPYELKVDFALNRTDLRFKSMESQSYFMVYSQSDWTVAFENEVNWARLGKTGGSGNGQVNVFCSTNTGVSRGVNVIVTNSDGRQKTIYVSQNAGMDTAEYKPEDETLDLFSSALKPVVAVKTNLDESSVQSAKIEVSCPGYDTPWISNVKATLENVSMDIDAFALSGKRIGTILISFPSAKWEENPCRCAITVNQTDETPVISLSEEYALDPAGNFYADIEVGTNWNPKYYSYSIAHEFSDDSWITDHKYDGKKTISIKPEANDADGAVPRSTTLKCVVKDAEGQVVQKEGVDISASATLTQAVAPKPLVPVHLTEGGKYANSFLIETTDTTLYSADMKMIDGTPVGEAKSAKVLWQTAINLIGETYIKDNLLYFTQSTGKTGNAVIGIYDSAEKIIWSYHIWITDVPVSSHKFGTYVFMDRNLGAMACTAPKNDESPTAGMHYEWGRKDPFPPVDGFTPSGNRDHMAIFPEKAISFVTAQDGKSLSYSIENPTVYLWGSSGGTGAEDWIDKQDADLWGGKTDVKTNYDPCPYGWEVPSEEQMSDILAKVKAGSVEHYGFTILDDNDQSAYFPMPGYYRRTVNTSSQMCNVSTFGWYWTRTTGTVNNAYIGGRRLQIHNTVSNRTFAAVPNRWGANVRCVKQN